jgi:NO-binding membrane sensor protein with MHYT domain
MFCKTKTEIIEMFMNDAKQLSIAEIRKITATRMLVLIATKELGTLVAGGVTTSAGVCIMHYVGMASMVFDGQIHWNAGLVALSVVIAMVASTAAFWILFRLLSIFPEMEWLRMASAFIMALAVNGMHYTGMVAAEFVDATGSHGQGHDLMGATVSESRSFMAVLIVANIVVWLLAHVAFSSSRESVNEKSKRLREAQEVFRRMAEATANGQAAPNTIHRLLEHYLKKEAKRKQAEQTKALASVSHTLYVRCMGLLGRTGVAPDPDGASVMSYLSGVSGVGNDSQINNSRISAGSHPKVGSRGKASDKTDAQSHVSHVSRESGAIDIKMPLAAVESTSMAEEEISPAEMV